MKTSLENNFYKNTKKTCDEVPKAQFQQANNAPWIVLALRLIFCFLLLCAFGLAATY